MKEEFNTPGSTRVQAVELSKTPAERAASMMQMQTDFYQWMDDRFELSTRQKEQIANLPDSFRSYLAEAIATELLAGRTIAFAKEEGILSNEEKDKDVLIFRNQRQAFSFVSGTQDEGGGLQIVIRYR